MNDKRFEQFAEQHKHLTVQELLNKWNEQKTTYTFSDIISDHTLDEALHCIRVNDLPRFKELVAILLSYYSSSDAKTNHKAYLHINGLLINECGKYGRIEIFKYLLEFQTDGNGRTKYSLYLTVPILLAIKHERYDFLRYISRIGLPSWSTDNDKQIFTCVSDMIKSNRDYKEMFLFLRAICILHKQTINMNLLPYKLLPKYTYNNGNKIIENATDHILYKICDAIHNLVALSNNSYLLADSETAYKYHSAMYHQCYDAEELNKLVSYYECINIKVVKPTDIPTDKSTTGEE